MKTKFNVIDLFCGCGGLSKGFELAGMQCVGGIDFNRPAIDTFSKNFKHAKGWCVNLLDTSTKDIQNFVSQIPPVDIIIGGPPCQGFSSANRYQKKNADPRNKLFFQFVKFVDAIKPKAIVIENVRGIITKDNGYAKEKIYEIFEKRGYKVNHMVLDASDYGVPQKRLRNFFVILQNEIFDFNNIKKGHSVVTVKNAIGELYNLENNREDIKSIHIAPSSAYRRYLRGKKDLIFNHDIRYPAPQVQRRISFVPPGGNWKDVPQKLWPTNRNNRHSSAYKRLDENLVSVTIDTGNNHSNYFHPKYNRIPTVREAARLQSFPDDFIFVGNRSEQYRQVGNAVPPLLAKAIAEEIKLILNKNEK